MFNISILDTIYIATTVMAAIMTVICLNEMFIIDDNNSNNNSNNENKNTSINICNINNDNYNNKKEVVEKKKIDISTFFNRKK